MEREGREENPLQPIHRYMSLARWDMVLVFYILGKVLVKYKGKSLYNLSPEMTGKDRKSTRGWF